MNPTKPDEDENKNTNGQTWSQDKNELGRGANENQANDEGIKQGQRKGNMKEDAIEGQNANDRENMAKLDENKAEFTFWAWKGPFLVHIIMSHNLCEKYKHVTRKSNQIKSTL